MINLKEEELNLKVEDNTFNSSLEMFHHFIPTSKVLSYTIPVDDPLSPFSKDSFFWEIRKTNHAVVNWHDERMVNIIVFHLDNLDEKKLKFGNKKSNIFIPAVNTS